MNHQDKNETKKGNIAERLTANLLTSMGYDVLVRPIRDEAHAVDFIAIDNKNMKMLMIDSKCKVRRNKYHDTGIQLRHYNTYKLYAKQHNMDVLILFVDEKYGIIYGNYLSELEIECKPVSTFDFTFTEPQESKIYPSREGGKNTKDNIIYFPLAFMKKYGDIPEAEVKLLKSLHTGDIDYTIKPDDITHQLLNNTSWVQAF